MKNNRFDIIYSQGSELSHKIEILVDKGTGVNYIFAKSGYSGGLTVLLDAEGKPVITRIS